MKARNAVLGSVLSLGVLASGVALVHGQPERDVSPTRHPNLAAAQLLIDEAFNRISDARRANEWDMDGHAAKAKEFLDQANRELKLAAEAANHNHR
jgi:hypothetical protein